MALAWAAQQKQDPALSALLGAEPGGYSDSTAPAAAKEEELPSGHILVFTLVLPDGLGDLIFGENAVGELLEEGPVAWVRCHVSEEQVAPGEELVKAVASSLRFNLVISGKKNIHAALDPQRFEKLWVNAKERFLAPWIFGLSEADQAILDVAKKTSKPFWALTEYGRSMGNIHTYSEGLGHQVPTGWTADGGPGGVFRSILRASRTGTAWRRILLEHCGLDQKMDDRTKVRLWWFYSRKDDEKKHSFRSLENKASDEELPSHVDMVSKVIPIDSAGKVARGNEKTSGEKLAEQLFQAASDPSFKPNVDVTCAEVAAGSAGQLSQFFWDSGLLTGNKDDPTAPVVDIIVAPNVFTARRQASAQGRAVARVKQVDLVKPDGSTNVCTFPPSRKIFICSTKIPRSEMRTFLEECEEPVYTTGDQSLAEAMWMGKVPCVKPDAKVQQWQLALMAKCAGTMESVPDLGVVMRQLTKDDGAREAARAASKRRSDECEKNIIAQLGAPPSHWNPTHKVLARSGMLG